MQYTANILAVRILLYFHKYCFPDLSLDVTTNTTMDVSMVNVNGNISLKMISQYHQVRIPIISRNVMYLINLFLIRHFVISVPIMILEIL